MSSPPRDDLKQQALDVFGKALSDKQIELYKGRLPTMLQNVDLLAGWSKRLDDTYPAQIQCPVVDIEGSGIEANDRGDDHE